MNNYILDGTNIWWPIAFPGDQFVSVLSKDLLNFEPLIKNSCYAPACILGDIMPHMVTQYHIWLHKHNAVI